MAKIYFRYGAMNSGKTTQLLQVAHNYEERGMRVAVLKPHRDTKGKYHVVSRLGASREVDYAVHWYENLYQLFDDSNKVDCVLVDEVQFFSTEQIEQLWQVSKRLDIPVITYGLRTDFKGNIFEPIKVLMAVADSIEELKTICRCGRKATMNGRKVNGKFVYEGNQVEIDNQDDIEYEAMCGKCYIEKVLQNGHLDLVPRE